MKEVHGPRKGSGDVVGVARGGSSRGANVFRVSSVVEPVQSVLTRNCSVESFKVRDYAHSFFNFKKKKSFIVVFNFSNTIFVVGKYYKNIGNIFKYI